MASTRLLRDLPPATADWRCATLQHLQTTPFCPPHMIRVLVPDEKTNAMKLCHTCGLFKQHGSKPLESCRRLPAAAAHDTFTVMGAEQ